MKNRTVSCLRKAKMIFGTTTATLKEKDKKNQKGVFHKLLRFFILNNHLLILASNVVYYGGREWINVAKEYAIICKKWQI